MNVIIQPKYYETMHVNRVFSFYIGYHFLALILILTIYIIFYQVALNLIRNAENTERIRFLEMQEASIMHSSNISQSPQGFATLPAAASQSGGDGGGRKL